MRFGGKNVSYITIIFLRWCVNECAWSSNEGGGGVYNSRVALVHFAGESQDPYFCCATPFNCFKRKLEKQDAYTDIYA